LTVLVLVAVVGFLDSLYLAQRFAYGQWLANALLALTFLVLHRSAPPRLKAVMVYGLLVGTLGEVLFSLILRMYEYRLGNVPLYIPLGHSILYAAVFYFVREPFVLRRRALMLPLLWGVGIAYSLFWLFARNDVYGALCSVFFLYLMWKHQSSRMFFAAMFLLVAYLEQVGTGFGAWAWPATLLDRVDFLPSANPPSGISVFYFGFDGACLEILARMRPKLRERYYRLVARRQQRARDAAVAPAVTGA
jgi:hypothetical protein